MYAGEGELSLQCSVLVERDLTTTARRFNSLGEIDGVQDASL